MTAISFDTLSHPLRLIQCVSYSTNFIQCLIHLSKPHSMQCTTTECDSMFDTPIINCAALSSHLSQCLIFQCVLHSLTLIHLSVSQSFYYTLTKFEAMLVSHSCVVHSSSLIQYLIHLSMSHSM